MAPISNKPKLGSTPGRGASGGGLGKSSGGKSGSSGFGKSSSAGFDGKSSSSSKKPVTLGSLSSSSNSTSTLPLGSSSKYVSASSYSSPKSKTKFGIIWIPTKRHNKKKDMVFNPHRDDRMRERSPSMYNLMSGDSDHHKRRDEEPALLVPDKVKPTPVPTLVTTGTIAAEAAVTDSVASTSPNEKTEFIQRDSKEATGDSNDKHEKEYLDNKDSNKMDAEDGECKYEKNKIGDKVDSVYLRPPPPHKVRSTTSTANDEEDCGIKCLYYTLQCCDCVLM